MNAPESSTRSASPGSGSEVAYLAERLRRLEQENARVREAHRAAGMTTWSWDGRSGSIVWGEGAAEILGSASARLPVTPRRFLARVHREDRRRVVRSLGRPRVTGPVIQEFRLIAEDGTVRYVQGYADRILDERGHLVRWCGVLARNRENAPRRPDSGVIEGVDSLTGIATLASFRQQVNQAVARARRGRWMAAVALLDLERFGRINEAHGHEAGDRILRLVAERLAGTLRESDSIGRVTRNLGDGKGVVSRLGGDKFVVLLEGLGRPAEAAMVVERVFQKLGEPIVVGDTSVCLTARAGISLYPTDGLDAQDLLQNAEGAIHHAVAPGSGKRVCFFSRSVAQRHRRDIDLELRLRRAIEDDSFGLAYQPKISLGKGDPIGFEALLRYEHPEDGPVSAFTAIELAERTGLIHDLGCAIFRRVCRDAQRLQNETNVRMRLFTNFSPRQLESNDWKERVDAVLRETHVDPMLLGIEITESVLVDDRASLVAALHYFASRGIEISLDDFGTGYSHLGYLTRLPLNELKIDRSFINAITNQEPNSREVAGLVVVLGRSLGIRVVAEGAETLEQVDMLRAMGCHAVQGYYFSRPQPLETFFEALRQGRFTPAGAATPTD